MRPSKASLRPAAGDSIAGFAKTYTVVRDRPKAVTLEEHEALVMHRTELGVFGRFGAAARNAAKAAIAPLGRKLGGIRGQMNMESIESETEELRPDEDDQPDTSDSLDAEAPVPDFSEVQDEEPTSTGQADESGPSTDQAPVDPVEAAPPPTEEIPARSEQPAKADSGSVASALAEADGELESIASAFETASAELNDIGEVIQEAVATPDEIEGARPDLAATSGGAQPSHTAGPGEVPESAAGAHQAAPARQPSTGFSTAELPSVAGRPQPNQVSQAPRPGGCSSGKQETALVLREEVEQIKGIMRSALQRSETLLDRVDQLYQAAQTTFTEAAEFKRAAERAHEASRELAAAETEASQAQATYTKAQARVEDARRVWEAAHQQANDAAGSAAHSQLR